MAQGAFIGAGGVKDLKSCYVGAGGVKAVKQIYIGQGGSVKLVWPSAIYSEGSIGTIGGGFTMAAESAFSTVATFFYDTGSYISAGGKGISGEGVSSADLDFRGGFTPSTIDLSPYSSVRVTYRITKASTRSEYATNNRVNSSLNILASTSAFSIGTSAANDGCLCCGSSTISWVSGEKALSNSRVSAVQCKLMTNSDTASSSTNLTLSLDVSSYSSSMYIAVAVAEGLNHASSDAFTIRIMNIDMVV